MGICGSTDQTTAAIEKELVQQNAAATKISNIILLGPGESGKSTVFKQIGKIYSVSNAGDDNLIKDAIHWMMTSEAIKLIKQCDEFKAAASEEDKQKYEVGAEAMSMLHLLEQLVFEKKVNNVATRDLKKGGFGPEYANALDAVWKDSAVQEAYKRKNEFQVMDSVPYFMGRTDAFRTEPYKPDFQDYLRCRIRTTGIEEMKFDADGQVFNIIDVGGQRNERRKWIHQFDRVTALLFLASLTGYNQLCFEDGKTNRMREALMLWEQILNTETFKDKGVVLFLNKVDLFDTMILDTPLTTAFPDYSGSVGNPESIAESKKFIVAHYTNLAYNINKNRAIKVHLITAVDPDNMNKIIAGVFSFLITAALGAMMI